MLPVLSRNSRNAVSPTSLHLDRESGRIFIVGLTTPEVAVIVTAAGKVEKLIPLPCARSAHGVSCDPESRRVFMAAHGSDELITVDDDSGEILRRQHIGEGLLGVVFGPVSHLAWVANRGSGTVTAVCPEGHRVANLEVGP